MIFQCLGITGAIFLFYSLISLAITHMPTNFFWVLFVAGITFLVAFIIMALNRSWQKLIILFAAFNTVWILLYVGHDQWHAAVMLGSCAVVIALIGWISKKHTDQKQLSAAVLTPLAFVVAYVFLRDKAWEGKIILTAALILNLLFLWVAKLFLKEMFQSRSMRYGTSAAVYSLIVGFILVVVNIGSQDFNKQFDFTVEKINTLSEQTVKVVSDLKGPMKITAFFEGQSPDQAATRAAVKNLLDRYNGISKNIEVLVADADKDKLLAEEKHAGDGDIVVEYNGQSNITKDISEQGVTQAILKVTRTNSPEICFTAGHGEMTLDDAEESPRSLSILKASLANEGYQPKTLDLISGIPSTCSIVVIPSPQQRFPDSEVALFSKYLDEGGKLIAMLDPIIPNTKVEQSKINIAPSGFEALMKKWGVKLGNNLMLEKHITLFQGEVVDLSVRSMDYGNHPIVDSLKGKQTYFNTVQSVQKDSGYEGISIELIKSAGSGKSWAETNVDLLMKEKHADPDGADLPGPVNIAMAVEKEGKSKTQLAVFGDGDFVSNGVIQSYEFNYDLFLNTLNWMSGEVERISIRPKKIRTSAIELTPTESLTIFNIAIITLPMIVLVFGINLWWYRRRRG